MLAFRHLILVRLLAYFSVLLLSGLQAQAQVGGPIDHLQSSKAVVVEYLNHRTILFATNRRIIFDTAREKRGGSTNLEDVFTTTPAQAIAYGWVVVGYPSDRQFGAQSFKPNIPHPNPFKAFSIESFGAVNSKEEAQKLIRNEQFGFDPSKHALVYVHGINDSFRDGVERLAQLVVDLGVTSAPVLFSWPSDKTPVSIFGDRDNYKKTLRVAKSSESYLNAALNDFLGNSTSFDLLAHSMGTLVAFDVLKERPATSAGTQNPPPESGLQNVVLAAPDIGIQYFMRGRAEFLRRLGRLTVYCGPDNALYASANENGDLRLGYCKNEIRQVDYVEGVHFVRVFGTFRDFIAHSYYADIPQVLEDLKHTLMEVDPNRPEPPYREIFLPD